MADDTDQPPASELIDGRIEELGDWRGETLARVRAVVHDAGPEIVEAWKWRGVPTWYHLGKIVCTGESYAEKIKVTFPIGASLEDPKGLFNASLEGNARRAIDFAEGDAVDEEGLAGLVRAVVASIEG